VPNWHALATVTRTLHVLRAGGIRASLRVCLILVRAETKLRRMPRRYFDGAPLRISLALCLVVSLPAPQKQGIAYCARGWCAGKP
jgi:hypothetical protein